MVDSREGRSVGVGLIAVTTVGVDEHEARNTTQRKLEIILMRTIETPKG